MPRIPSPPPTPPKRTLTRLTATGALPHVRIGSQKRYELEALLAYVARQRRGG